MSTPCGYRDGTLEEARFSSITGMVEDDDRNIFLTDQWNHSVRKIDISRGIVSTVAGKPKKHGRDDGDSNTSRFTRPSGIARDGKSGDLFVVEQFGYKQVRRLTRTKEERRESWTVTTIKIQVEPSLSGYQAAFFKCDIDDNGNLFVASDSLLVRCKLDGTDAKVIAQGTQFSAARSAPRSGLKSLFPTKDFKAFCVCGNTVLASEIGKIRKLYLYEYWNEMDHRHFPSDTRQAIKMIKVAANRNGNNFSKLPTEMIHLILTFIPW
jgi:hypothetical protein